MPNFSVSLIKQPRICPIEEGIRESRGREKMELQCSINYRGATG
jgi:hypothetical protein